MKLRTLASVRARAAAFALLAMLGSFSTAATASSPPVLKESSVDNGWTSVATSVGARYSKTLRMNRSTAKLTDVNGLEIAGATKVHINTITFYPAAPLTAEHGPYAITFSVVSVYQEETAEPVVDTLNFQVDRYAPYPPTIDLPQTAVEVPDVGDRSPGYAYLARIAIAPPNEDFVIHGWGQDAGVRSIYDWSGIAKVEARFFGARNPSAEQLQYRVLITVACTDSCPFDARFAISTSHLPTGYWTARVAVHDHAGNRSADSESVSFLVARA